MSSIMLDNELISTAKEKTKSDDTNKEENDVHVEAQVTPPLKGARLGFLVTGLMLSMFVAVLDRTIVSTSLTQIMTDFDAMNQVTWIAASYLLTSTAMQPLYGKLSDIFGRKPVMVSALSLFLVCSLLCGLSQNLAMMIAFRALSGIGGGGLFSLSVIIISDVVPMQKRSIYMSLVGATFAIASIIGPLVGGFFSDQLSWRWSFYINAPVCLITIITIYWFLDVSQPSGKFFNNLSRIDFQGTVTLVSSITCLILALNWGGNDYAWSEWQVIVPLVLSCLLFVTFFFIEIKVANEPIVPFSIFNRNIIIAYIIGVFHGGVFMVGVYYIPIYYQMVHKHSATIAGLELMPYLFSGVACNFINGFFVAKTGIYRPISQIGALFATVGMCLLGSLFRSEMSRFEEIFYFVLLGIGQGFCYQNNITISQAAASDDQVAVVTSMFYCFYTLGGLISMAIQGAVFTNSLSAEIVSKLPDLDVKLVLSSAQYVHSLSSQYQLIINNAYYVAFRALFLSMIPYVAIPLFASFFLQHIPLRGR